MTNATENFIVTRNIAHYKMLLREKTHENRREMLLRLLENEIAKLPPPARRVEMRGLSGFSIT